MIKNSEKIEIRLANETDNNQIIELVKKYPTSSDSLSYVVDRSPNYFKFAELQGYNHKVLVAISDKILGSLVVSFDKVYLDNSILDISYTCDLRVDPSVRKTGVADSLMIEGVNTINNILGTDSKIFTCVLKDNKAGLKKNQNLSKHGILMKEIAQIKTYFIFPFYTRKLNYKKYNIRFACQDDIEKMFLLWQQVNENKNLSRFFDLESFKSWVNNTEGLGINNYLIAEKNGELVGFMGLWNQSKTRRIIIYSQNKRIKIISKLWNLSSKIIKIPQFPSKDQELNFYNITNLCLKDNDSFNHLIYNAFIHLKKNNSMFLTLALDKRDKLNKYIKKFIYSGAELFLLSNYKLKTDNIFHVEISLG